MKERGERERERDRQTDRRTETEGGRDRQTERQTERGREREGGEASGILTFRQIVAQSNTSRRITQSIFCVRQLQTQYATKTRHHN